MTSHFSAADLERLSSGTLPAPARRQLVAHLLAGCGDCSRRLSRHLGYDNTAAIAEAEYDAALDRAVEATREGRGPAGLALEKREDGSTRPSTEKRQGPARPSTGKRRVPARRRAEKRRVPAKEILAARREAVAMLTSLLAGERRWKELSAAETELLGTLPRVAGPLEASQALRHHDPRAMLRFAKTARRAADRLDARDFGAELVADLRALAWAELGNAYRICDDLAQANRAMDRAICWARKGSRNELLLAAIATLLASLLGHQRRFAECQEMLTLVYRVYSEEGREHLAGRALISAGLYAGVDGAPGKAILLMRQGLDLLDLERDPQLVAQTLRSMIWFLVDLGRYRRARRLLWRGRPLFVAHGSLLDMLRLRWLEGRIHAGLADFPRAEAALQETRAGFAETGQVYPAALAGLDLAALWARQGRVHEIRDLAEEMIATFRALRVAREAIAALLLLKKTCEYGGQIAAVIDIAVSLIEQLDRQPISSRRTPKK
ncbi:MAG TPA: hypothetical protein VHQ90_03180 [Thermoanaerobaculia bacterium]|nr:hypothetical protein [Thermoanaerobaculia bacterium]